MRNLSLNIVFVLGLSILGNAQQSVDASGGYGKSAGYSFVYSLGEIGTVTLGSKGVWYATGGVIQPDGGVGTYVKDNLTHRFSIYPVPTGGELHFQPAIPDGADFEIYSMEGVLVSVGKLYGNKVKLHHLSAGAYFMFVSSNLDKQKIKFNFIRM